MKKLNVHLYALFAILFSTTTTYSWEWPWKTQQAKNLRTAAAQQLAQYQARLRTLWADFISSPYSNLFEIFQDVTAMQIRLYWRLSTKQEQDFPGIELEKRSLIEALLRRYDSYKNIKNPNTIELKTLKLLEDWHYKYSNNKPDIHQKQQQ